MATFGDRLKALRTARNISQEELGKRFNLSQSTIAYYEVDKKQPSQKTLQHFADFFDVTVDYLLGRTNDPKGVVFNDLKIVLDQQEVTYGGVPLSEEQLKVFRDLMKVVATERIPKYLEQMKKDEGK